MKSFRLVTIAFLSGLILLAGSVAFAEDTQQPPDEALQGKIQAFKNEQAAIQQELEGLKANFANATEEEKRAAIEAWREENADRIQAQKELMAQIRSELHEDFNASLGERIRERQNARERMREKLADINADSERKEQIREEIRKRRGNGEE